MIAPIARLAGNLLLALGAVAATLLLGELGARRVLPEWAPAQGERSFWRYDELLGWTHVPGGEGVHRHEDFEVTVRISEQGLRDRVYPPAPAEGRRRMLVLGDSFAFGQGVERDEIWHEVLEARHPGWEIVNTAVAGWGTSQQLLYLEHRGLGFSPDVVVLMLHPNDFLDNNEPYRYGYFKPTFVIEDGDLRLTQVPVPQLDWEQRLDRWLRVHTYLLYRVYHAREFLEAWWSARAEAARAAEREERRRQEKEARRRERREAQGGGEGQPKKPKRVRKPEAPRPEPEPSASKYDVDLELTLRLLERMRERTEAAGARFLVVSVPMADPPRAPFLEALSRRGIDHLALDEAFAEASGETRFQNDPHWTPLGQRVAAQAIETYLTTQRILN